MTQSVQWRRFANAVNRHAPRSPISISNAFARAQSAAGNTMGGASALADGLRHSLPDAVGPATSVATASSGQDIADAAYDEIVGRGAAVINPEAGIFVGNGIAVLRGAIRAIERSDRVEDYLNQLGGYTDALTRCSIDALFENVPYATVPQPPVPAYANDMGRLYSGRTRGSWVRGHSRVAQVIREMDQLRPSQGDWYSKTIFIQLFLNATGMQFVRNRGGANRHRRRVENYIVTRILFINEFRRATRLRRWGNTG